MILNILTYNSSTRYSDAMIAFFNYVTAKIPKEELMIIDTLQVKLGTDLYYKLLKDYNVSSQMLINNNLYQKYPLFIQIKSTFGSNNKLDDVAISDDSLIASVKAQLVLPAYPDPVVDPKVDPKVNPPVVAPAKSNTLLYIGLAAIVGLFIFSKSRK